MQVSVRTAMRSLRVYGVPHHFKPPRHARKAKPPITRTRIVRHEVVTNYFTRTTNTIFKRIVERLHPTLGWRKR